MDLNTASQTEWNGGTLTNIRIHDIRTELKQASMMKDLKLWLALLVQMNHEVYGFETEQEKVFIRNKLEQLADKINEQTQIPMNRRFKSLPTPAEVIYELNNMQYILDEIFHKSGLQTALKEDAGDAF
jgi:hypothetical protein